jgi:hypothetical protein
VTAGVCRVCGCTDDDCSGCVERTGEPCSWVEPELCSACAVYPAMPARGRVRVIALDAEGPGGRGRILDIEAEGAGAVKALAAFVGEQLAAPPPRRRAKPRRKK